MKPHIKEEKWFEYGAKYSLMMKARSDTLKLGWRNWATDEEKICKLCGREMETNKHFLLRCFKLDFVRNLYSILQRPQNQEEDVLKEILLCSNESLEHQSNYLQLLWEFSYEREKIIKSILTKPTI